MARVRTDIEGGSFQRTELQLCSVVAAYAKGTSPLGAVCPDRALPRLLPCSSGNVFIWECQNRITDRDQAWRDKLSIAVSVPLRHLVGRRLGRRRGTMMAIWLAPGK